MLDENVNRSKIDVAKQIIAESPDADTLRIVLKELTSIGVTGLIVDAWCLMSTYLKWPFSRNPMGIRPSNKINDSAIAVEMDIDSMIHDFEVEISKGTPEPELYLHVAQYYFDIDRPAKARSILKKGMQAAENNHIINIYYCENLSFTDSNTDTFERHLMPVLSSFNDFLKFESYKNLCYFYLCTNQVKKYFSLIDEHTFDHMEDHLSFALATYLSDFGENPTGAYNDFAGWRQKIINDFYKDAPDELLAEQKINNSSIYGYCTKPLIPTLLKLWRNDKKIFFKHLLDFKDDLNPEYLDEFEYAGGAKAVTTLLSNLCDMSAHGEDYDFWLIIYLHSIQIDHFINEDMREHAVRLANSYPTSKLMSWKLKVQSWWGRKEEGVEIIPLLFELGESLIDGDYEMFDMEDIYSPLIANESSKTVGTRPIPFYSKQFLYALEKAPYPQLFLRSLWSFVIRPCVMKNNQRLNKHDINLIDFFNKHLPNEDPMFVKAWLLLDQTNYTESIALFQNLIEYHPHWYGLYRNISYAAECLGNLDMAYEYEKKAHDQSDMEIPDNHATQLDRLKNLLNDQAEEINGDDRYEMYFKREKNFELQAELLDIITTLKLISYLECFSIPGTGQFRPLLSKGVKWLPGESNSIDYARQMILDRTAFITNKTKNIGIKVIGDSHTFNFRSISFALNFQHYDNVPLLMGNLHSRFNELADTTTHESLYETIKPFLVDDLIDFAIERFTSYDIPITFNAGFKETAEHCLEYFPLTVCYGILYHEIEDAAGAQREKNMSYRHTINYGLKCARNKATNAHENKWKLKGYDRTRSASEPSALISLLHTISKIHL